MHPLKMVNQANERAFPFCSFISWGPSLLDGTNHTLGRSPTQFAYFHASLCKHHRRHAQKCALPVSPVPLNPVKVIIKINH
jgi:hypothetical protein